MPHIAITMLPGRSPEQKKSLARKLREVLSQELQVDNLLVSVSVSDLPIEGWGEFFGELPQESIIIPEEKNENQAFSHCRCSC